MFGRVERPSLFQRKTEEIVGLVSQGTIRRSFAEFLQVFEGYRKLNPIRVAIIGCGKIAEQHASQIRRIACSQLVGVCDSEKRMADQLAERYQVEGSFDNVQQLLKESRPDVVHITTPPQSHFKLATE